MSDALSDRPTFSDGDLDPDVCYEDPVKDIQAHQNPRNDAERQELADDYASLRMRPGSLVNADYVPTGDSGDSQPSMSPITEEQEEADKRYTEQKEADERYFDQRKDWMDELKRTTPEDVEGTPLGD